MSPKVVTLLSLCLLAAPIKVVAAGSAPFVIQEGDRVGGLSVDLWEKVALEAGVAFTIERADTVADAIAAVRTGRAEAAIGPISITAARTASVAFTQPYFQSKTGILTTSRRPSAWSRVESFVSAAFFYAVGLLLLVLLLVGVLIWLIERRGNTEQFPEAPGEGIAAGMWLALVTMTTVGYGDKAPVTGAGRIIVGIWMVISMITASSLTAAIATALTVANLEDTEVTGLGSLEQKPVAVMKGTTAVDVARSVGARLISSASINDSIGHVLDGSAIATISDLPILQYEVAQHPEWPVKLIASDERVENYGFALAHGNPMIRSVNLSLLRMVESGELAAIRAKWLGQ